MSLYSNPKKKTDPDKRSLKSHMDSSMEHDDKNRFDQGRIIEHYIKLKEHQQQKLANINLSQELKRKLFGFSEGYYLTNAHDPYKLVIMNHPMKGRFIMSQERFHYEMHNKHRERQFKTENFNSDSGNNDFSGSRLYIDSDLDAPFPQESDQMAQSPNPEFDSAHMNIPQSREIKN